MIITVQLHTTLQRRTPEGWIRSLDVLLPEGGTIADIIEQLGITLSPDALLIAVNGRVAELNQKLADGDQVNLMPAISGG